MQVGILLSNRYRIDAKVGEGGMGVVYRAHDTLLDRDVAIKSLSPQLFSADGLKRLLREAQAAAKLTHPGIVTTHDVVEEGDGRYIVMEFVEGKTLREAIPMAWREAVTLMHPVFEAIEFAHSRGIVHRDLKPENIIVTAEGTPKVMDFGLARTEGRSRLTQTGLVVGTALYMAPEQALQGKAVPQSDLYALGCVFYELVTGQPPFSGEDPLSIITQHINMSPRTPRHRVPDLPPGLEALMLKLLAKDPAERPRNAGDVARMLSLMLAPVASTDTTAVSGPALVARRRRVRLVGRTDVMGRLLDHLDGLMAGMGGMAMLSGEPGIGKTRLLDEIVAAARVRGFQVLVGRCHERDVAIPYLPVADALEGYARNCAPERWEQLLQSAGPEIEVLLSDSVFKHVRWSVQRPEVSEMFIAQGQTRPVRAVRNVLNEIGQTAPVVLAIDDLHWADPASLELLHSLALYTRETPLLILGAYREIELERTHPLSRLLTDLNRERLLTRERLRRLNLQETDELLVQLLESPPPTGLSELIHEQTEGNPFFIEELVNGLLEEGRLVRESNGRYELASGITIERLSGEIPQGVRAAIGARLDRLEPVVQQALGLASVVGRHFSLEVLASVASAHGLTEDAVEDALKQAQAARLIRPLEEMAERQAGVSGFTSGAPELEADFAFDHPLIHQVVYGELDRRRKRRLHAEVGYLLEQVHRGAEVLYAERLAYHFVESDEDAKALEYSILAGDKMMRAYYDADMALGYYLSVFDVIVGKETSLRHLRAKSPVPIRRGAIHQFTTEERDAVITYLGEVLEAVRDSPAAKAVAQMANRICVVAMHTGEVYEASIRLYEQCLLGPDVQKIVVDTARGKLVGILEFPGPGGPYPVVMLFHGAPASKEVLADETRRFLARGLATLRVDLPGFGETTVPLTDSPVDSAEALKEMVSAILSHERAHPRGVGVVGWSYGPLIAAHLCARDPRVRAMVGISGVYNPLHPTDEAARKEAPDDPRLRAFWMARWKAGTRPTPGPITPRADASAYDVAGQIQCHVLIVYGALEPERFRVQAEEFAALVPTAKIKVWRSGVHALFNIPEALESAADWMKEQLLGPYHS